MRKLFNKLIEAREESARKWIERRYSRETLNSLNKLSDRELKDIGLSRSEIRSVAYNFR